MTADLAPSTGLLSIRNELSSFLIFVSASVTLLPGWVDTRLFSLGSHSPPLQRITLWVIEERQRHHLKGASLHYEHHLWLYICRWDYRFTITSFHLQAWSKMIKKTWCRCRCTSVGHYSDHYRRFITTCSFLLSARCKVSTAGITLILILSLFMTLSVLLLLSL